MVVDEGVTARGYGHIESYKDGILDPTIMPYLYFSGLWQPFFNDWAVFESDQINRKKKEASNSNEGIIIDDSQVTAEYNYKNRVELY